MVAAKPSHYLLQHQIYVNIYSTFQNMNNSIVVEIARLFSHS
jgi:hypothetical protein